MADTGIPENASYIAQFTAQAQIQQVADLDDAKRSAIFARDLTSLQFDLSHVKSKSFKFDPAQDSKLVLFLQNAFDKLRGAEPSGNNGKADAAFLAELSGYVAAKNAGAENGRGQLADVRKLSDFTGLHLSAVITELRALRGPFHLGSDPKSVKELAEALLEVQDKDVKERAEKFLERAGIKTDGAKPEDTKPGQKPPVWGEAVPGTDGKLAYDAKTNTLTLG